MQAQDFLNYKNWAVAGDVLDSSKYAFKIFHSLKGAGFNVVGVNPRSSDGTVYKNLSEAGNIDVLDLCINYRSGIELVKEAAQLGIPYVLIQPGAESDDIIEFCKNSDIIAIEGCVLVELSRR